MIKATSLIFTTSLIIQASGFSELVYRGGTDLTTAKDELNFKLKTASTIFDVDTKKESIYNNKLEFSFSVVTDRTNLRDDLKIDGNNYLDLGNFLSTVEGRFYDAIDLPKDKVFILVKVNRFLRDYKLSNETFTQEAKELYDNDFETFREKYGDSYVNKVSIGGTKFALLEIPIETPQEKVSIEALIDTKNKVTSLEEFYNLFDFLEYNYRTTKMYDLEKNSYDIKTISLQEFATSIEKFNINIENNTTCQSNNPEDFLKCAFLVNYKTYDQIDTIDTNENFIIKQNIINEYINYEHLYVNIIKDIENIQNYGKHYVNFIESDLTQLSSDLEMQRSRLKYYSLDCKTNKECKDISSYDEIENLEFPKENALRAKLPQEKVYYPKNCQEVQQYYYQAFHDREYKIYILNEPSKEIDIYCYEMNTTIPTEYLTLNNSKVNYKDSSVDLSHIKVTTDNEDGKIEAHYEYLINNEEASFIKTDNIGKKYIVDEKIKSQTIDIFSSNFLFDNSQNSYNYDTNLSDLSGYYAIKEISNIPNVEDTHISELKDETNIMFKNIASEYFTNLDYQILENNVVRLPNIVTTDNKIIYDIEYGLENIDKSNKIILKLK